MVKLDFIMRMLFKMASNGNLQAIKEICNYGIDIILQKPFAKISIF